MKVIDLLNKIANGEDIPQKIKLFGGVIFEYSPEKGTYLSNYDKFNLLNMNNHLLRNKSINLLNEEIEIIEEDKKIDHIYHCCMEPSNEETKFLIQNINDLSDKIN